MAVKAKIYNIEGFSGHADQDELIGWISAFTKKPRKVFLVHGENQAMEELKRMIISEIGCEVIIPEWRQVFDIAKDTIKYTKTFEPSQTETELLYKGILNKLMNMYDDNIKNQDFNELYSRLKHIEKAI